MKPSYWLEHERNRNRWTVNFYSFYCNVSLLADWRSATLGEKSLKVVAIKLMKISTHFE